MRSRLILSKLFLFCFGTLLLSLTIFHYNQTFDFRQVHRSITPQGNLEAEPIVRNGENQYTTKAPKGSSKPPAPKSPCVRQVQFWQRDPYARFSTKPQDIKCPGLDCSLRYIEDTSYDTMAKSDAVIWWHGVDWEDMLNRRPSNQVWVFYTLESPDLRWGAPIPPRNNSHLYNYTITYKRASTIQTPYGSYDSKRPQVPANDNRNWAQGKTELVAWMASNCKRTSWKRNEFVQELAKHIKVDIYGGCGKLKCPRGSKHCLERIRSYKFYLALENNLCEDNITEKFWQNALNNDVVPIVYGAPKEDYLWAAPPNSFIHLEDFNSIPELTDYFHLLDSNDTLYNSFFDWKRHGSVREKILVTPTVLCQLLLKIRKSEDDLVHGKQAGETVNLAEWWCPSCREPSGFPHDF